MTNQDKLREWHTRFAVTVNDKPTIPSDQDLLLRCNLILEEALEFIRAAGFTVVATINVDTHNISIQVAPKRYYNPNMKEMYDALSDLEYVTIGSAVTLGLDMQAGFDEAHRSNMTKVWEDGTVHYRPEDNKVLKPPTYSCANFSRLLSQQGWIK